jgi:pimeloyl-ACP methyl ester carboxylesterase
MPTNSPNTLVIIRHGIFSDDANMQSLTAAITNILPNCTTDNSSYDWQEPILHSGIRLARLAVQAHLKNPQIKKVIFVGHSQGGLVCRVAAAALLAPTALLKLLTPLHTIDPKYYGTAEKELGAFEQAIASAPWSNLIKGVVTLATPNSGAFTYGQMAIHAQLALFVAKRGVRAVRGWKNFDELTTDRLFRILQHLRIPGVPYLSVSGSRINRYRSVSARTLSSIPVIGRFGLYLDLPNDLVVEDSSVDLGKAPLPCEIENLGTQYTHVRSYRNCIDVSHSGIHSDPEVFAVLERHMSTW